MKLFKQLSLALVALTFGLFTAAAADFTGTYEGKAKISVDGVPTWVTLTLAINGEHTSLTISKDSVEFELEVKAFIDHRGTFYGILMDDEAVLGGFGGRIGGNKHSHVVGRFIQDDFSRPFILKKISDTSDEADDSNTDDSGNDVGGGHSEHHHNGEHHPAGHPNNGHAGEHHDGEHHNAGEHAGQHPHHHDVVDNGDTDNGEDMGDGEDNDTVENGDTDEGDQGEGMDDDGEDNDTVENGDTDEGDQGEGMDDDGEDNGTVDNDDGPDGEESAE